MRSTSRRVHAKHEAERERGAECLVRMDPRTQTTALLAPNDGDPANARSNSRRLCEDRSFTFDKSFWSHDEADPHYAHQEDVYRSFGEEFLDHNFDGYHTCIFAYGQTGSGKSYTMMGTPAQPGLIPRTCEALFDRIQREPSPNTTYSVHVSYFEVYNEHVRDLLVPRANAPYYLKIRESQTDGVYVQGLTDALVKDHADVERLMKMGDVVSQPSRTRSPPTAAADPSQNRTTASTKMNDTSSRSHAVFTILLKQIQHSLTTDETIERVARMRLVDLAGSERAKATEATGQRLVEGGKINRSLTTLGRVIAALADPRRAGPGTPGSPTKKGGGGGGGRAEVVPYRDSVLTWLLKDSLGGNSKTAMVACISPADHDETLSTLRYADQAKRIRTRATANDSAVSAAERDAQIAQMAAEIRKLQLSVNAARAKRERDEAGELEEYQKQVGKMQRAMAESKQVSEARIRALAAEVAELRPLNAALRQEIDSLRRHLGLALGELKNPIVVPPLPASPPADEPSFQGRDGGGAAGLEEEEEGEDGRDDGDDGDDGEEAWAAEIHADAEQFLQDLGVFKRKLGADRQRFGPRAPSAEVRVN